ncbi:hypothetical protein L249_7197 [Ophiocordyceps polyrhachis-furcata BCC 54312]|uniref:AMP-dependent synthetase/ligase domain-containing protein n=1 Tax=Ophiocordyceps polyrhachis-furcata BCC 54312 TaxID=1330021 RepID=A0A367LAM7_9HYPO|nr:hypothetical protein L249_7197 [Ophiocordyceps polyrhachis-furcata BCC 54312]
MSSRIRSIVNHLLPPPSTPPHLHHLSPTFFLQRAADIEPDAEAVFHTTATGAVVRRSYRQLASRAVGLAYYLRKHGLTRVAILAPNTPAFLEAIYGIVAAGGVIVPVNYRLKQEDIAYILDFADVDCVIVDYEFRNLVDSYSAAHPAVPIIVDLDTDVSNGPEESGPYNQAVAEGQAHDNTLGSHGWAHLHSKAADEDDMLAIPFTSGTTSRPKGVVFTHRGAYLAAMAEIIDAGLNIGRCRYLWTLPMFHAVGWTFPWAVVAVRGVNVCLRKIDYPLVWKLLKEQAITHFSAAPTVNTLLVSCDAAERLSQPVQVTVAASPPSAHLLEQMTKLNLVPIHVYGMTETYGPITKCYHLPEWNHLPPDERFAKLARQGHGFITSLPIRVVRTDQPDGVLVDVAKDGREMGEIVFVGNICAKGYYKDEEATRRLFAGGVLHSGDLAVWHPDGSAQILDRSKDIIISGGENISSVALEGLLAKHPDLVEVGVVAVKDERWGERPRAFVTVREGVDGLEGSQVVDWAKNQPGISGFMVPREVIVLAELPKTSTGKIKKNELRAWKGDERA